MMQISSMPDSMASSPMIWMTGLVSPSRSTSGNISFWTAVEAGYCRVPRPAAVMTALRTLAMLEEYVMARQQATQPGDGVAPPQLDYGRERSPWWRRRWRVLVLLAMLSCAIGVGLFFRREIEIRAVEMYWARRCATFAAAPDTP